MNGIIIKTGKSKEFIRKIKMNQLPTSNYEIFRQHLLNPNTPFEVSQQDSKIVKIQKNLVLAYQADSTGCGHIRCVFPMTYLNAIFGKTGKFNLLLSPVMIFQHDILLRTRTIFFQRTMNPAQVAGIKAYKEAQKKYNFKMVYEIDDFIWRGTEEGESIPEYNFGSSGITDEVRKASLEIMNMMDIVCVSTKFLGDYIKSHGVDKPKIVVIPNVVTQYFWGPFRKQPIKNKIVKPKFIWTGSPTHYNQQKKMKGDMDGAWCEWILKNVKDNKIDFIQMGGLPFFFDEIKDKIKLIPWVNSYQYPLPIKESKPDFSIGPLVPNFFNYSKSDIKYIESIAYGAAFIGNTWKGTKYENYSSPYDNCIVNVPYDISYEKLDDLIWSLTEPEKYNEIIKKQYEMIDTNHRWLESPAYVKLLTDTIL
jgi:hypothetical protein